MIGEVSAAADCHQPSKDKQKSRKQSILNSLPVEINAQRLLEFEIPLQQLEQKVDRLESEMMRANGDITEAAIKAICGRINDQPFMYIPKIHKKLTDFKKTLDDFQRQILENMNAGATAAAEGTLTVTDDDIKANKFLLDTLKREIDLLKISFSEKKAK